MSTSYYSTVDQEREEAQLKEQLRLELGWKEVAYGLGHMVIGYVIWAVVIVVAGIIVAMAIVEGTKPGALVGGKPRPALMWQFFGGIGLLGFGSLYAWWTIIKAQWRCLLHVPDRTMARWFLFFCFTCVLTGPVFNVLAGAAFSQSPPQLAQGPVGFQLRLTGTGYMVQLMGFVVTILQPMFFLLFLRSVAAALHARFLVFLMNIYLAGWFGLVTALGYLQFGPVATRPKVFLTYAVVLGLVGIVWGLAYFGMIFAVRSTILSTVASVAPPREAPRRPNAMIRR